MKNLLLILFFFPSILFAQIDKSQKGDTTLLDLRTQKGYAVGDKRVGIWEFYNHKGELEQKYDFTKYELVYFKVADSLLTKKYEVLNGRDTTKIVLERPPLFIGGEGQLFIILGKDMNYPPSAKDQGFQGKVYISFVITKAGRMYNPHVKKGFYKPCDDEALRAVKNLSDYWLPGILNGDSVDVIYTLPISFKLSYH